MKKLLLLLTSLLITHLSISQNALNFDGVNDLVQTSYTGVRGTANRTFEAWIYLQFTPSGNSCIMDYGLSTVAARNTFLVNSNRAIAFIAGGTNTNITSSTNVVPLNTWSHVAFVKNGGTGYLYVNGIQVGTGNLSGVNTGTGGSNLKIGNRVSGGNIPFRGVIDEVRVWDVARTQTEIASAMNIEFCSAPSSLKAYYRLNQGTAGGTNTTSTTVIDDAGTNNGTLSGFSLSGTSSNWVSGATISPVAINSTIPVSACGSYTMQNGTIVSATGTYFDTISSSVSCDSLDAYVISITTSTIQNVISDSGCVTYTTPMGKTITTTGTYYDTLGSSAGCDSLIQYDITISGAVDDSVYRVGSRITSFDTWASHQWIRCDSNNLPIPGATNRFIDVTQVGDYAVVVTRGNCMDTSECINFNPASLNENLSNSFSVYPNPANEIITIMNSENKIINDITIFDVSGKLVDNQKVVNSTSSSISITTLENGVYFMNIQTVEGAATIKFVKN